MFKLLLFKVWTELLTSFGRLTTIESYFQAQAYYIQTCSLTRPCVILAVLNREERPSEPIQLFFDTIRHSKVSFPEKHTLPACTSNNLKYSNTKIYQYYMTALLIVTETEF